MLGTLYAHSHDDACRLCSPNTTDFESGAHVLGDPAGARGKPGRGYGIGAGLRIQTPIGPVRLEYAWNDAGVPRFHLGIGARD